MRPSDDGSTFSEVPSENDDTTEAVTGDRRSRKRAARRDHLLDLAAELVEQVGVDGVTMAALAEAADYAPASLYTYFDSRSALLAALQQRALRVLGEVAEAALAGWEVALGEADTDADHGVEVAALARLWAFSDLFLVAPERHPREFRLQQQLLTTPDVQDLQDAASVLPVALQVLDVPRRLLAAAVEAGALAPRPAGTDPLDRPVDGAYVRTIAWVAALNGVLLADGLTTGLPTSGADLGNELTGALLRGWGADAAHLAAARALSARWVASATPPDPSSAAT